MKIIYLFIFFIITSCGYPDIDSVPDFEDMNISKKESIDLCKLSNSDNEEISKCIAEIEKNN